jgi:nicotinate-nucleotide adenylyltransferase
MTGWPARLGILGGTFDPIHDGHLAIAAAVEAALELETILFIPAAVPPHKVGRTISPAADRRAMVELAIAGHPSWALSTIELDRPGPSYSVDTLAELARSGEPLSGEISRDPSNRATRILEFILSAEALAGFPDWHEPGRILELARLAVVPRSTSRPPDLGRLDRDLPGWRSRVDFVDSPLVATSASTIRERVRAGLAIGGLVPEAVAAYIRERRLYTDPS